MIRSVFLTSLLCIALASCKKEKIGQQDNDTNNNTGGSSTSNKFPVAIAGPDHHASRDTFYLDGSASNDPDGSIVSYEWKKIAGPGDVTFSSARQMKTNVHVDWMGFFQFELTVTDNGGLTAKDSVSIYFFLPGYLCDTSLRAFTPSNMTEFWQFPFQRFGVGVTTLGSKVYFAGGRLEGSGNPTAHVAILDMETKQETQSSLSIPRALIGCVSAGSKLFFAGGWTWQGALARVEIIDVATGVSTMAELSEPRWGVTTAVLGNKVFFAGGFSWNGMTQVSSKIDIYDLTTGTWSVANLSEARGDIATTIINGKLYFAGGSRGYSVSSAIDIYDGQTGQWAVSHLQTPIANASAITVNGKTYFAGGYDITLNAVGAPLRNATCNVQIRNANDAAYLQASLISKISSTISFKKNNRIIFFPSVDHSTNFFDVYDLASNTWSVGLMPNFLRGGICFVYNDDLYVAGGWIGSPTFGPVSFNNKILKLEIN